jgi:hypothetical protein
MDRQIREEMPNYRHTHTEPIGSSIRSSSYILAALPADLTRTARLQPRVLVGGNGNATLIRHRSLLDLPSKLLEAECFRPTLRLHERTSR